MSKTQIRIGNASGYWGDDPLALSRQVRGGQLDYITMDFLAEITMSIMQKQKNRDPQSGYAKDFLKMLKDVLPDLKAKGIRIITNAGGVNPQACALAIQQLAKQLGIPKLKIAVVFGDDIKENLPQMVAAGHAFRNMETGEEFAGVQDRIEAANIYFGALPVVKALEHEPDLVITGRVTDTGITLAPMIYEFGWSHSDWNSLAAGIIAGHIMECGSQACGGNFTDWQKVPSFHNIGYPLVEMRSDGSFVVTKHENTGGLISTDTVREQLFYEMGNPKSYITPDVIADFSSIKLRDLGTNRVEVFGIRGFEPTPLYKVSMAYRDGFKNTGLIAISGPNARRKAETFADIFWQKVGSDFADVQTEYVGWNACHQSLGGATEGNEILLRLGARDDDAEKLVQFAKTIPTLILGGPPGVTVVGGVPKPAEVISYWPALLDKNAVMPRVAILGSDGVFQEVPETKGCLVGNFQEPQQMCQTATKASMPIKQAMCENGTHTFLDIALARSGDKGDTCNVGVIARSQEAYEFLKEFLTAQRMKDLFQELCLGKVTRYELPSLYGFNFMLENALGGGGTLTLRLDAQGKTFAQALIRQKVNIPERVLQGVRSSQLFAKNL